jgi:hypothetical protein
LKKKPERDSKTNYFQDRKSAAAGLRRAQGAAEDFEAKKVSVKYRRLTACETEYARMKNSA